MIILYLSPYFHHCFCLTMRNYLKLLLAMTFFRFYYWNVAVCSLLAMVFCVGQANSIFIVIWIVICLCSKFQFTRKIIDPFPFNHYVYPSALLKRVGCALCFYPYSRTFPHLLFYAWFEHLHRQSIHYQSD